MFVCSGKKIAWSLNPIVKAGRERHPNQSKSFNVPNTAEVGMKRSFQRRIKRWFLEELTRRLDQCHEINTDRTHCLGLDGSGLRSAPAEGMIGGYS